MRIVPYLPADIDSPQPLVDEIRQRRGGELLHLDRMLLHSPPLATGWNTMMAQIRHHLSIPAKLRELIMCCVALLNGAEYEFYQHAPCYVTAGGRDAELVALRAALMTLDAQAQTVALDGDLFTETEQDVVSLTIQSTRHIVVQDELKRRLVLSLGAQQLVELVSVVASYNMVSRFLVALDISHHDITEEEEMH